MKNYKILSFCFFIQLFASFSIFTESSGFHINVSPFFGVKNGTQGEYVYIDKDKNLSQLDWKMEKLFYLGAESKLLYKNFFFTLSGAGYFPKSSGTMTDSDWLGIGTGFSEKTNISYNENKIDKGFFLTTDAGYNFPIFSKLSLKISLGFEYNYYFFKASNGYGWYGDPSTAYYDKNAIFYDKGELGSITLERKDFSMLLKLNPVFYITKYVELSPYFQTGIFSFFKEIDNHLPVNATSGGVYYYDEGSCYFKTNRFGMDLTGNISEVFSVNFKYSYTFTTRFIADLYQNTESEEGPFKKDSIKSAFDQSYHNFAVGLIFKLF